MNSQQMTIHEVLQKAIEAHKTSKLQDAERLYRTILQVQVNHPDANHNLGVLAVQAGKPEEGLPYFKLALETNPKVDQFWISYVDTLTKLGKIDEAISVLNKGKKIGLSSDVICRTNAAIGDYVDASKKLVEKNFGQPNRNDKHELNNEISKKKERHKFYRSAICMWKLS